MASEDTFSPELDEDVQEFEQEEAAVVGGYSIPGEIKQMLAEGGVDAEAASSGQEKLKEVIELESVEGGEGFMAVKPWIGAIVPPSDTSTVPGAVSLPDAELELHHVFGYRCKSARNNVYCLPSGEIVYPAGAVVIVNNPETGEQRFLLGHTDDVISLAVDKSFTYAAGGGIGASPLICIWDISSGEIIAKISGLHKRSINALAFSPDGRYIVSVGGDNNHRIAVYECHSGRLVASTEGDTNRILCCAWGEQSACGGFHIATGGMKHMKLWTLSGSSLSFKQALWGASGRPTVVALEYLSPSSNAAPSQLLAATAGGDVFRFSSPSSKAKHSKGHAGSVYALSASPVSSDGTQLVASGGRDGKLCIWKANGELVGSVQACASPEFAGAPAGVCAAAFTQLADGTYSVVAGTRRGEVKTFASVIVSNEWVGDGVEGICVTQGHFDGEVWGLAVHPDFPIAVTTGDDNTVILWDLEAHTVLAQTIIDPEHATEGKKAGGGVKYRRGGASTMSSYAPNQMARAASFSPDGNEVAIGLNNGSIKILDGNDLSEKLCIHDRKQWIQAMQYSPDGRFLAVGSHDNFIDVYDATSGYSRIAVCKGHSSFITALDWCKSNPEIIHTTCGAYELLFFDATTGQQLTSGATATRDAEWATWTVPFGWPVQGIWPAQDGTAVNSVCRSADGSLLVTGDDFSGVNLFSWPVHIERAPHKTYGGHSSHVTAVRFVDSDNMVISAGGNDCAVMVWHVKRS